MSLPDLRPVVYLVAALVAVAAGSVGWDVWTFRQQVSVDAPRVASLVEHVGATSVLAVVAHPDDEAFIAGALADAVERGADVRLITVTRGDNPESAPPYVAPEHYGAVREAEAYRSGYLLGLTEQEVWRFPDGGVWDAGELRAMLTDRLDRWRPDLLVTFDPASGFTGHEEHRKVGHVASGLFDGCTATVIAPEGWVQRYEFLRNDIIDHQPPADVVVPIDPDAKVRSWEAHESQAYWHEGALPFPLWLAYRVWNTEAYALSGCR